MYGRQGDSNNTQPWSVRAEVTIRHGTPVTSESSQAPVGISSTVTDSGGVRMIYRWNTTSQSSPSPTIPRKDLSRFQDQDRLEMMSIRHLEDVAPTSRIRATTVSDFHLIRTLVCLFVDLPNNIIVDAGARAALYCPLWTVLMVRREKTTAK